MRVYIQKPAYSFDEVKAFIEKSKGIDFEIEVKEIKDARSVQQNRFFHGALIDAFVRLGDTNRRRIKRILKERFLSEFDDKGQFVDVRKTRDLSVDEMRIFIDNCVNLLADYGGYLEAVEHKEYRECLTQ